MLKFYVAVTVLLYGLFVYTAIGSKQTLGAAFYSALFVVGVFCLWSLM